MKPLAFQLIQDLIRIQGVGNFLLNVAIGVILVVLIIRALIKTREKVLKEPTAFRDGTHL